jgi:phosphoglycolate phosphatase
MARVSKPESQMRAKAALFDKDGTLFDFQKTWGVFVGDAIAHFANTPADARAGLEQDLATAVGFDLQTGLILAHSPAIAGTVSDVADVVLPLLASRSHDEIVRYLDDSSLEIVPVEVTPLVAFFDALAGAGLKTGVATNDSEAAARAHLRQFDAEERPDSIVGYDSGYGAKPGPGMCTAFAQKFALDPTQVVMVGDSLHDLQAGRAAGMQTVAVLTGVASANDLRDHADVVLPDITHLLDWLQT